MIAPDGLVSFDGTATIVYPSPFNRSAQHDAKRLAILSQAAKLLNYQGSRATTLRDIAASLQEAVEQVVIGMAGQGFSGLAGGVFVKRRGALDHIADHQ